jgi:hypothetical protein
LQLQLQEVERAEPVIEQRAGSRLQYNQALIRQAPRTSCRRLAGDAATANGLFQ